MRVIGSFVIPAGGTNNAVSDLDAIVCWTKAQGIVNSAELDLESLRNDSDLRTRHSGSINKVVQIGRASCRERV